MVYFIYVMDIETNEIIAEAKRTNLEEAQALAAQYD